MVDLITDNDETTYKEEVRDLAVMVCKCCLCAKTTTSPLSKTKEIIVDYRKKRIKHAGKGGTNTPLFTTTGL